jgi:hypothetical protein
MEIREVIKNLNQFKGKIIPYDTAIWFWRIQRDTPTLINRGVIEKVIENNEIFFKVL